MDKKYASLQRAKLHLDFIYANSMTYSFLFGALAELMDNARDSGAARLDVFSVDHEELQGGFMLCFLDDGCGMSPEEASDIIYFGTSKKQLSSSSLFIGQYGNGLKSGAMRIGKDFILFTKKEETMTCLFFSQTFCEKEGLTEVVVPIPSWLARTRKSVTDDPQKFATELGIIFRYSPFKTQEELMQQFNVICGRCGTFLVVYNLKLLLSGEPELDIKTDNEDIRMADSLESFPERWSLRAYASVLYFEPRMRIFIQSKRVQTKHLCYCLYKPRKYHYVTSSFKGKLRNEVKKAEEAVKTAELRVKEIQFKINQPDGISSPSDQAVLQKAVEYAEAKHKQLKETQRELRKARTLLLVFGVNFEDQSQSGMFIYSNNRLIKMHEKVGPQLKMKSLLGTGVVGIVNIPLAIMEPSHNKQEFLNVQEYNRLLKVMGKYLVQYCKDTGVSNRNLSMFWNEFRYQNSKDTEKSSHLIHYQRRQAMAIPHLVQCDQCLKWRVLPSSAHCREEDDLDIWICANNPNRSENSCHQGERLPSIPLGTMNIVSSSKPETEKQLSEFLQRYQDKLEEWQPQKFQLTAPRKIPELTTSCLASAPKLSLCCEDEKRCLEDSDSDVEFVEFLSKADNMKRPRKKQRKVRRSIRLVRRPQVSSLRMTRSQSESLEQGCKVMAEVEASDKDPDVILVCEESRTDVLLNQERQEVLLINEEEKQELYSDLPETEGKSPAHHQKCVPIGDSSPGLEPDVASLSGSCKASPSWVMPSQSISVKETVRKLTAHLREILLYFLPECQLTSEFDFASVEELIGNPELEQSSEQTNEKLRICFNQIQHIFMAQYERKLKRKMQSIIYESNRRGVLNEVFLTQCEHKRKLAQEKLDNLRAKLVTLLQKFQLGGPAGELEQIDDYLEALLKRDTLPQTTLDTGPERENCDFSQ